MRRTDTDAFGEMMKVARGWLAERDPREIAERAGAAFDGRALELRSLGEDIRVAWPAYEFSVRLEPWRQLVLLHYLNLADGTPLSDRLIGFADMRGGLARGGDFDRRCEFAIERSLGALEPRALRGRCAALGARFPESNADFCAELPFLPRFPMTLKLWFADEEFPASGRLMLNAAADHYLSIEDAVTAGTILMEALGGAL